MKTYLDRIEARIRTMQATKLNPETNSFAMSAEVININLFPVFYIKSYLLVEILDWKHIIFMK